MTDNTSKKETAMRKITSHVVNPANDKLVITVLDEPGSGGANHCYRIDGFRPGNNPSRNYAVPDGDPEQFIEILFQNGPIGEVGVNGITHEALLAILIDRLRSFASGPFASRENSLALTKLEEAAMWLEARTKARMARGVEGKNIK